MLKTQNVLACFAGKKKYQQGGSLFWVSDQAEWRWKTRWLTGFSSITESFEEGWPAVTGSYVNLWESQLTHNQWPVDTIGTAANDQTPYTLRQVWNVTSVLPFAAFCSVGATSFQILPRIVVKITILMSVRLPFHSMLLSYFAVNVKTVSGVRTWFIDSWAGCKEFMLKFLWHFQTLSYAPP